MHAKIQHTYHYAYHSGNQPGAAYNGQQTGAADHTAQAQPTGQTYGTPSEPPEPGKPEKKKNKKTIAIVVSVLVVCVVIAVTGIVLAATGVLSGDKEEKTDGASDIAKATANTAELQAEHAKNAGKTKQEGKA